MDADQSITFNAEPVTMMFPGTDVPAVACIDNVLDESVPRRLIELANENRHLFAPSAILDGKVTDQRRSKTCLQIEEIKSALQGAISSVFPKICQALGITPFQLGRIEAQMTFHQDGDYFKAHRDNRGLITRSRLISYVYYFRTEAAEFEGGQLCLHKTDPEAKTPESTDPSFKVEPLHNRIVFFLSDTLHEVLPIRSESQDFIEGRGSIVGWLRSNDLGRVRSISERSTDAISSDAAPLTTAISDQPTAERPTP